MGDRQRIRVGRDVIYRPTDAEAATGNGIVGDSWTARITAVNESGTVSLAVFESDGGFIAKTAVPLGEGKGTFALLGAGPQTL